MFTKNTRTKTNARAKLRRAVLRPAKLRIAALLFVTCTSISMSSSAEETVSISTDSKTKIAAAPIETTAPVNSGSVDPTSLCPESLIHLGNGNYFSDHALVVDKKARILTVWKNQNGKIQKVKEYPSDIGKNNGVKVSSGDYKTPEGIYFFQRMLEGQGLDFSLYGKRAFTTNYPNLFDLREGKTGTGIWLHAIPETKTLQRGSRGCVVVRNESILDVSPYIQLHTTPFVIFDDVPMVSSAEQDKKYQVYRAFFEDWRKQWESKNVDDYIAHYSDSFETNGMNKAKWKSFKKSLADRYKRIHVQFSEPMVVEHKDQVIIRSLQRYASDLKEDFGEKDLYVKMENGQPRIIAELWLPVTDPKALAELPSETPGAILTNVPPDLSHPDSAKAQVFPLPATSN